MHFGNLGRLNNRPERPQTRVFTCAAMSCFLADLFMILHIYLQGTP
jgi:hypothetical protein